MAFSVIPAFLSVAGGLAMVVLGFRMLNDRILLSFGSRIRDSLVGMGQGSVRPVGVGFLITAGFHSFTGLSVLLMSLVNVGLASVGAAIAVAFGAALGQLIPVWIFAAVGFSAVLSPGVLPVFAVAVFLTMMRRRKFVRLGEALMGFALASLGILILQSTLPNPQDLPRLLLGVRSLGSTPVLFILAAFALGVLLSFLTQSSPSVLIVMLVLCWSGWFPFYAAAAMAFGANIGVVLTLRRAVGAFGEEARHFNRVLTARLLAGVVVGLAVVLPLERLVVRVFPDTYFRSTAIPFIVMAAYSAFSLLVTLMALLGRRVFLGARPADRMPGFPMDLPVLPRGIPDSLEANLITTRSELGRMADQAHRMLMETLNASQELDRAGECRDRIVALQAELFETGNRVRSFLTDSIREPSGADQARDIAAQSAVARDLVDIGEAAVHAANVLERIARKNYRIHKEAMDELYAFTAQVLDFLKYDGDFLSRKLVSYDRDLAVHMEGEINTMRDKLRKRVRRTLERDDAADIRGEFQFMDIVRYLEIVGDDCLAIGREIPRLR